MALGTVCRDTKGKFIILGSVAVNKAMPQTGLVTLNYGHPLHGLSDS